MKQHGTLIFFCGKMGAGKSTAAARMAEESGAILLSEDTWLAALYPDEIAGLPDYLKYSARLKGLLTGHVRSLLLSGQSVVMDFPGNTRKQRAWFREIVEQDGIPHRLIYLNVPDTVCLERIAKRRTEQPDRAAFDSEEVFHHITSFFEPPTEDEAFNVEERKVGEEG